MKPRKRQERPKKAAKGRARPEKPARNQGADRSYLHPAEAYARAALAGQIPCCAYALKAFQRHFDDLSRQSDFDFPYFFDEKRALHALNFFSVMRHWKGEWAGRPLILEPWQQFIIWCVFGWLEKTSGVRRFRVAYIEIPRKNGKTFIAAGVAVYLLDADGEPGAEVFCVAADEQQARRAFDDAVMTIRKNDELSERFRIMADCVTVEETNSVLAPLPHNADALHGKNPSGAIIDETHAHKDDEVFDVIDTGRGSRREPLLFCISTAGGRQEGLGWELSQRAKLCLDRHGTDDRFFAIVYCADQGDPWDSEVTHRKANPNYGVSIKPDYFAEQVDACRKNARKRKRFEQLHLNVWSQIYVRWLDLEQWDRGARPVPLKWLARSKVLAYAAVDLSARRDLTCVALAFRRKGRWFLKTWHWITRESLEQERPAKTQLVRWGEEGLIHVTDERVIDHELIFKRVKWIAKRFNLVGVAVDPWNAAYLMKRLDNVGITVVEYPQRLQYFAPPCRLLEEVLAERKLAHGGNPVLRWQAGHVAVKSDDNGNLRPTRKGSADKIDGIVATLMAMGLWQRLTGDDEDGAYSPNSSAIL